MKVAVTSKDGQSISGHAGHCKGFLVYEVEAGQVSGPTRVELQAAETLHASEHRLPEALGAIKVLISGGMGNGLFTKLKEAGVEPIVTAEVDPKRALSALLAGTLSVLAPHTHGDCHHS
jgi:predicted Fe-Mo cluster-binding NifX family protein